MLYLVGRSNRKYYVLDTDDYIIEKVSYEKLKDMVYYGVNISGMSKLVVDTLPTEAISFTHCLVADIVRNKWGGESRSYIQLPIQQHDGFICAENKNYAFYYNAEKATVHVFVHGVYYTYEDKNGVWCIGDGGDNIVRTKIMHNPYFIGYDKASHQVVIIGGRNVFFNSDRAYTARDLEGRIRTSIFYASRHMNLSEFKRLVLLG